MKQKTAIRQLIEKLEWRIKAYTDFNNGEKDVSSMLALQDAKELESVNEQQIKDAYVKGCSDTYDADEPDPLKPDSIYANEYFNETFEKP